MTFERTPGLGPEPVPNPPPTDDAAPASRGPTPIQIRLQILTTEHWSLLASRGLAWNESFNRAGMYLSTLSGAIVALSLIGGVDGFHDAFFVVALVVLPAVLFVGVVPVADRLSTPVCWSSCIKHPSTAPDSLSGALTENQ